MLALCNCKESNLTKENISKSEFSYFQISLKDNELVKANKIPKNVSINDSTIYYPLIQSNSNVTTTIVNTESQKDNLIYILYQNRKDGNVSSLLTSFTQLDELYRYSTKLKKGSEEINLTLIGHINDKFSFINYRINELGEIKEVTSKNGLDEIIPELPFTNPIDSILTITKDSVTVYYEERLGVHRNTVSYIAKVITPTGCIHQFLASSVETESNEIDMLRDRESKDSSKFIIYINDDERTVKLENYKAACGTELILNLATN